MTKIALALAAAHLLAACGDDGRVPPADTGTTDTGVVTDTGAPDTSGPGTAQTAMLRAIDQDDNPLEGVKVAIDTDLGRFEGETDAAGEVMIPFRYMEDSIDTIAALEGYRIVGRVDSPYEAPDTADGFGEVTLFELDPDLGDRVRVVARATGVPAGGRWCVGIVSFFMPCLAEGAAWDNRLGVRQFEDTIQDYVYGYALDDTGALYDFARADWTVAADGGRSLTLAFDGTLDETPMERDITINFPSDAESSYRTETLDEDWQGWLIAVEPGTYLPRSALTMVAAGADSVTARVHYFPITGDELVWAAAPYVSQADAARSFIWYSGMPADAPIDILDLPRVRAGTAWTDEFEWTPAAADVDNYFAQFYSNGGVVVISIGSNRTVATVPALPTGYDTSVSFPFPGAPGELQVLGIRGDPPPDDTASDPYRVDAEASWSLRHPITF